VTSGSSLGREGSPGNLFVPHAQFGFSFLLHLYSSPLTHHRPPPAAMHGRPDAHAMFQLWLSLTEVGWSMGAPLTTAHMAASARAVSESQKEPAVADGRLWHHGLDSLCLRPPDSAASLPQLHLPDTLGELAERYR
jgi:hypothetical protein